MTATIDQVHLICEGVEVACHVRSWDKHQFFFDPVHYLALLERKPGRFDHARPFENWELPVCLGILRRRFEAEFSGRGTKEFIKVLRLLETHSLTSLKGAVEQALEIGATSADAVRLILEYQEEQPVDLFCLEGRPHLKLVHVRQTSALAYQSLLSYSAGAAS